MHVRIAERADLVAVVPATADVLARLAHGRADDLVTALALCARGPVLAAPAMHPRMWEHPATQRNVAELAAQRRVTLVGPVSGEVASGDVGHGAHGRAGGDRARRITTALSPRDLARAARRRDGGADARGHRSGAVPRQPLDGQDGLRRRRARGGARAPR